jgi:hypothetical protein
VYVNESERVISCGTFILLMKIFSSIRGEEKEKKFMNGNYSQKIRYQNNLQNSTNIIKNLKTHSKIVYNAIGYNS